MAITRDPKLLRVSRKIGRNLKIIREAQGMKQKELHNLINTHKAAGNLQYKNGRRSAIGHGTLSEIENGKAYVPNGLVPILCDIFQTNAQYFFNGPYSENLKPQNPAGAEQLRLLEDEEQKTPYKPLIMPDPEVTTNYDLIVKIDLALIPTEHLINEIKRRMGGL